MPCFTELSRSQRPIPDGTKAAEPALSNRVRDKTATLSELRKCGSADIIRSLPRIVRASRSYCKIMMVGMRAFEMITNRLRIFEEHKIREVYGPYADNAHVPVAVTVPLVEQCASCGPRDGFNPTRQQVYRRPVPVPMPSDSVDAASVVSRRGTSSGARLCCPTGWF